MRSKQTSIQILHIRVITDGGARTATHIQKVLANLVYDTFQNVKIDIFDTKSYWKIEGTYEVNLLAKGINLLDQIERFRNALGGESWEVHHYSEEYWAVWNKKSALLMEEKSPRWAHIEVYESSPST